MEESKKTRNDYFDALSRYNHILSLSKSFGDGPRPTAAPANRPVHAAYSPTRQHENNDSGFFSGMEGLDVSRSSNQAAAFASPYTDKEMENMREAAHASPSRIRLHDPNFTAPTLRNTYHSVINRKPEDFHVAPLEIPPDDDGENGIECATQIETHPLPMNLSDLHFQHAHQVNYASQPPLSRENMLKPEKVDRRGATGEGENCGRCLALTSLLRHMEQRIYQQHVQQNVGSC